MTPPRLLTILLLFAASLAPLTASAQAIAPVTHDHHTHRHNPDHPTVSDSSRFHTSRDGAPLVLPVEEDAFVFAVFGDRTGGPNEGIDVLAQAVADVNLIEPDLVMTVGDLIQGYNEKPDWLQQMTQYKQVMGELICPWFPVAGNHDIYYRGPEKPEGEHEGNYELHFGPLWYAFEHKGCLFVVLYSDEGDPATGEKTFQKPESQRMSDEQFDWLKQALADHQDASHVFVFLHHPRWLGRNYGNDWDKIHDELVKAGNVTAVFGGHIHHMRYDPRDGIEYVTLATVGGHQNGWSPSAGFLHHYNLVTVRDGQVAMATYPVGAVMDPRSVTGEVSEQAERLARANPIAFGGPLTINDDGSVRQALSITVSNPAAMPIEVELRPTSQDSRWSVVPDHRHGRIEPGQSQTFTYEVARPAGPFDATARRINAELGIDMLADTARFAIPVKTVAVPGTVTPDATEAAAE